VFDLWDRINAQDRAICESQQIGVGSRGFSSGEYAEVEDGVHAFDRLVAARYATTHEPRGEEQKLWGIWGRPYLDLSGEITPSCSPELDEEIAYGLARVHPSRTGGSLKWMSVVAPWVHDDPYVDYGHVIGRMSRDEFVRFASLGEDPEEIDPDRRGEYT